MTEPGPEQTSGTPAPDSPPPPPANPSAYPPPPVGDPTAYPPPPPPGQPQYMQPYSGGAVPYGAPGPLGKIRSTGTCILLFIVTLGIYGWFWYYNAHEEMKRHTGQGIGGVVALLLAIFISIVMPYITSSEVGDLYERDGKAKPVSGATGLWYFPGIFIIVGPIIWFVKTNGALNEYWASKGQHA
jgi:hypothetical protein